MTHVATSQVTSTRVEFEEAKAARQDQRYLQTRRIHRLAHQVRRIDKGGRRHA